MFNIKRDLNTKLKKSFFSLSLYTYSLYTYEIKLFGILKENIFSVITVLKQLIRAWALIV